MNMPTTTPDPAAAARAALGGGPQLPAAPPPAAVPPVDPAAKPKRTFDPAKMILWATEKTQTTALKLIAFSKGVKLTPELVQQFKYDPEEREILMEFSDPLVKKFEEAVTTPEALEKWGMMFYALVAVSSLADRALALPAAPPPPPPPPDKQP